MPGVSICRGRLILLSRPFDPACRVDSAWVRNDEVPCLLFSMLIRRFSVTSVLFDAWLVCLQVLVELLVELSSWMGSSCTISARGMALVF